MTLGQHCPTSPPTPPSSQPLPFTRVMIVLMALLTTTGGRRALAQGIGEPTLGLLRKHCFDCHNADHSEAGVNLEAFAAPDVLPRRFRKWLLAADRVEQRQMPPRDAPQPTADESRQIAKGIRDSVERAARNDAGDPGRVVMRRLTGAEYGYVIRDLTGIDLDLGRDVSGEAVGGTGFTNMGNAQFVQDATLERYLAKARRVASHAVIGAGPLTFHENPGRTGLELSAIQRIQAIYRQHGFRTAAGEGGKPFGLDKYPRAFYTAWRFHHRARLGQPNVTLKALAEEEQIDVRFVRYINNLLMSSDLSFPTSDVVRHWRSLPVPQGPDPEAAQAVRKRCDDVAAVMGKWQRRFGTNPDAKEEAPVLREDLFDVGAAQPFEMNINWPSGTPTAHLAVTIEPAVEIARHDVVIIWRKPRLQFRVDDQVLETPRPLSGRVAKSVRQQLQFGVHPRGGQIDKDDFVTVGATTLEFEIPLPANARSARLTVEAQLDASRGEEGVFRCTIAQLEETDQGKSVSGLLADPRSPAFASWKAGVLDFARRLPQVSHREPAPSDRDPIPAPFDPSYNNPERNRYHTQIKYHRDDDFLVRHMLHDVERSRLDQAWADLQGAFEFHDLWLRFVAEKFGVQLGGKRMDDVDEAWIAQLPATPRTYVEALRRDFLAVRRAFAAAERRHIDDVVALALRGWHRPPTADVEDELRRYYQQLRVEGNVDHATAIRTMVTRVLVSPNFLYRAERVSSDNPHALSNWELANRLSFFLWSSTPDAELRRAAADGELEDLGEIVAQARRMLKDPRAKRFATEFFGQWFGFYRFEEHQGIDPGRFPEFSDGLKAAMHEEAVSFFDYIVRENRPVREIVFADYAFLNQSLADHYGIEMDLQGATKMVKVNGAAEFHRGGVLRLGAVLASTSAPLRTSPVKRGDWILGRVLGSPVPPPPADAGSIAGDDAQRDGLSMRERLAAHRRDAACVNCHRRIDPLGFALENFDPVGRWRTRYRDGKAIDVTSELQGMKIDGEQGLHAYLARHEDQFLQTLSVKLLGYALGRGERVGDLDLLRRMQARMARREGIAGLVEEIVVSKQFRYRGSKP